MDAAREGPRGWWRSTSERSIEDEMMGRANDGMALRIVPRIVVPLLAFPIYSLSIDSDDVIARAALALIAFAVVYVFFASAITQRFDQALWIRMLNTSVFAAIITAVQGLVLALEHDYAAVHWVAFCAYFLLIAATGLSDQPRLPLVAAALSIVGSLGLHVMVVRLADAGWVTPIRMLAEHDLETTLMRCVLIAGAGAMAIAGAQRGRMVRKLTLRDGLTGLLNRRAFEQFMDLLAKQGDAPQRLAVAMIDIDHFKRVNDQHGHAVGDAVLRHIARWLDLAFRSSDVVARYGGEEFVVLFTDGDEGVVRRRLEELRRRIAETAFRVPELPNEELSLTVSVGFATAPADGEGAESIVRVADERLYEAKAAGRDRVVGGGEPGLFPI